MHDKLIEWFFKCLLWTILGIHDAIINCEMVSSPTELNLAKIELNLVKLNSDNFNWFQFIFSFQVFLIWSPLKIILTSEFSDSLKVISRRFGDIFEFQVQLFHKTFYFLAPFTRITLKFLVKSPFHNKNICLPSQFLVYFSCYFRSISGLDYFQSCLHILVILNFLHSHKNLL